MNEKEIRFIDLFGGIGGFRYGLEKASSKRNQKSRSDSSDINREPPTQGRGKPTFDCVWYCDKDKYAVETYNKNFKENHEPTDITKVKPENIPSFDMLCAGFPCQSFSIAGKRKGFKDTRGTMFFEICKIAQAKRPRLLFLENVKGLLSHDNGRTFETILKSLDELGYNVEWQVLNSKNFGVPQNRERVFIIGHLRGNGGQQVFPLGESSQDSGSPSELSREKGKRFFDYVANTISQRDYKGGNQVLIHNVYGGFNEEVREFKDYSPTIRTPKGGGHLPMVMKNLHHHRTGEHGDGICEALDTSSSGGHQPCVMRTPLKYLNRNQRNIEGDYSFTVDGANTGDISYAIDANYFKGTTYKDFKEKHRRQLIEKNNLIRRLTPVECERLQGFPDNWTEGVSDTQRYKQLGNAVTVNVIESIGANLN